MRRTAAAPLIDVVDAYARCAASGEENGHGPRYCAPPRKNHFWREPPRAVRAGERVHSASSTGWGRISDRFQARSPDQCPEWPFRALAAALSMGCCHNRQFLQTRSTRPDLRSFGHFSAGPMPARGRPRRGAGVGGSRSFPVARRRWSGPWNGGSFRRRPPAGGHPGRFGGGGGRARRVLRSAACAVGFSTIRARGHGGGNH